MKKKRATSHFGEHGGGYETGDVKLGSHDEAALPVRKVVRGNRRPMRFASLHHHSTFSYLDGYQMPEAHVRRATELQMGAFALTEHGNVDSHVKFEAACEKVGGVKPIFGNEVYMPCPWADHGSADSATGRGLAVEERTQRKMHLTLLAMNAEGYRNLLQLTSWSWDDGFYSKPTVSMEQLRQRAGGLIALSGCAGSLLSCSVVGGKGLDPEEASFKRGLKVARDFKEIFDGRYFIEVQGFPELEDRCQANPILARIAHRLGIRLVGTMDCHYTALAEAEVQQILHNLRPGKQRTSEDEEQVWGYDVGLCPPLSDGAIVRKLQATGLTKAQAVAAVQTTADIAESCNVTLPRLAMPQFPVPKGQTVKDFWRQKLREGWRYRGMHKLRGKELRKYRDRLRYEVEMIESKDFITYFLIVSDAIVKIKDQGIPVGPARGSAAGSLVAYVLRITEVDPLRFPLLIFERFIDVNREDLPDIDLDLPSEVRDEGIMRDILEDMYPSVVNAATYTQFKGKMALDDTARVFNVPKWEVDTIKNFLIERSSGDLRASATVQDTIDQFPQAAAVVERHPELKKAELLEGNVKGMGVHAAAYIVSDGDIKDVTAVYHRKIKDMYATVANMDKYDAERQGLLKIDFLGLSTMSAIWQMMRWIGMGIDDLYSIPLDDPKVYQIFKDNDVTGIFQFDGRAMRSVNQILKPDKFEEVMDCNALSRPGPLHNGAASLYSAIKFGRAKAERLHPAVDAITETTQFQIVYQEQILRIVREIGDFPWTHAAYIRKIISRKIGEQEFNRQWDRFWDGCQTLHERMDVEPITLEQAKHVWGNCVTSGSYAFNAAHCCAYGLLAVWTAWFKTYHKSEFFAAMCRFSADRQRDLLRNAVKRHGIQVCKPRIGRSDINWEPEGARRVRAGYRQIDSIGPKTAEQIVIANPKEFSELITIKGIGKKTIEKIEAWIAQDDPFDVKRLETSIEDVKHEIATGKLGELPLPTYTSQEIDDLPQRSKVVWLGEIVKYNVRDLFEINQARGNELDVSKIKDPHLREFAICYARDADDQTMLRINRYKWPKIRDQIVGLEDGHLVLVAGAKPRYGIMVDKLWVIDPSED